jgi:hypothetical protein
VFGERRGGDVERVGDRTVQLLDDPTGARAVVRAVVPVHPLATDVDDRAVPGPVDATPARPPGTTERSPKTAERLSRPGHGEK